MYAKELHFSGFRRNSQKEKYWKRAIRLKQSTLTFSEQSTYSSTSGKKSQLIYTLQVFLTKKIHLNWFGVKLTEDKYLFRET